MNSPVPARGPSATLKALVADAKTAARERNWATALALGDAALSRFEDAVPSVLYRIMSKAYRGEDRVPEAFAILMRGWAGRRGDDGLVEEIAGLAGSFHSLSDAATFVRECAEAGESLSQSDRRKLEQATRRVVDSVAGEAAAATRNKEWKKAESLWEDILVNFGELAPPIGYIKLSQAHRRLGRLEDAAAVSDRGSKLYPNVARLARERAIAYIALAIETGGHNIHHTTSTIDELGLHSLTALAIEGLRSLRSGSFDEAKAIWSDYEVRYGQGGSDEEALLLEGHQKIDGNETFLETKRNSLQLISDVPSADEYCVYTAVFGGYDALRPPLYHPPGIRFICFTDEEIHASGWELRLIERPDPEPALASRKLKIFPHEYISGHRYSLYVDANLQFLSDVSLLHALWLRGKTFVAWRHSVRSGVFDECETMLSKHRHVASQIIDQYKLFRDKGIPEHSGLVEASFLWRDHSNPDVQRLMKAWWAHLLQFGHRDQPGLGYLMWLTGITPEVMPLAAGTTRKNGYFVTWPHPAAASAGQFDSDES